MTPVAQRQRVKTLADLALRARGDGHAELAAARAASAFETSLSLESLVGPADLVRLEQVQALATARADLGERDVTQVTALQVAVDGGQTSGLYVLAASRSTDVVVGGDVLLAGQIGARTRGSAVLADKVRRFKLEAGRVDIFMPAADGDASNALHALTDLQGVRSPSVIIGQL
jgi:hypothetical protein